MNKIKNKIIFTTAGISTIVILILSLAITGYGTKNFTKLSTRDASKENTIQAKKLELTMKNIENSVNQLASISLKMLHDLDRFSTDEEYLRDYELQLKPIAESIADNTQGTMSFYIRFNPDFTPPTSGLFYADTGKGVIEDLIPTDFSMYDKDDFEHVGWYYIPVNAGRLRGNIIFLKTVTSSAPKSLAASIKVLSILARTEYIGRTIKGIKLYTMPSITAPLLYKRFRLGRLRASKALFIIPFLPSRVIQA